MVSQVPVTPEALGNSQQTAEIKGEKPVHPSFLEELIVDEVVRDCVRVPPETDGDHRGDRKRNQADPVSCGQRHEETEARSPAVEPGLLAPG